MTTKIRKTNITKDVLYLPSKQKKMILSSMKQEGANGYIKEGTFSTEIIWGNKSFVFSNQKKRDEKNFKSGMFLFGMVRKDAKKYVSQHEIKLPKKERSIIYNDDFKSENFIKKICGTDLNHAYWRIAYNLGVISENTYERGLDDRFKSTRLAALSTLGRRKNYLVIKDGALTQDIVIVEGDEGLSKAYLLIRYTCYKYMNDVKKLLGDNFLAYKTDCIYYIDTESNREKVMQYFSKKDLLAKQLS
jgi:hypothetical protein